MARLARCAFLVLIGGLAVLCPVLTVAQEPAEPKAEPPVDEGYRLKITIEAEIDWLSASKPASNKRARTTDPAENAPSVEPARPARRLGGRLVGKFTATWSLEPRTPVADQKADQNPDADDPDRPELSDDERDMLRFTNEQREKAKLPPLQTDPVLMKMAREQSAAMARLEKLSHELEGRSFNKRLTESKYEAQAAGENCAEGAESPGEAVDDWMTSPGHRANIVNEHFTHIGIAVRKAKNGRRYWTQVFAKPF